MSEILVEKVVAVQSCDVKLSRHFSVKKKSHKRPYVSWNRHFNFYVDTHAVERPRCFFALCR